MTRRITAILSFALLTLAALPVFAQDMPTLADLTTTPVTDVQTFTTATKKVEVLLSGYDFFPTRSQLEAATPLAKFSLIQIAGDVNRKKSIRVRAVDALGYFKDDPTVAEYFETTLANQPTDGYFLRHTITAALKSCETRAVPWVEPILRGQDLQAKLSAVHGLAKFGGLDGQRLLENHRVLDTTAPLVKENIERALVR
jgi:hypothetical protein